MKGSFAEEEGESFFPPTPIPGHASPHVTPPNAESRSRQRTNRTVVQPQISRRKERKAISRRATSAAAANVLSGTENSIRFSSLLSCFLLPSHSRRCVNIFEEKTFSGSSLNFFCSAV